MLLFQSSSNTKSPGFTIVELVVVILIVGILSVSVGPRFFGKVSFDNRKTTNEIRAALRYSQQLAMTRGGNIQFSVTPKYFTVELRSGTELLPVRHPSGIRGTKDEAELCDVIYAAAYANHSNYKDNCHLKLFPNGLTVPVAASVLFNGLGQPVNTLGILTSGTSFNVGSSTIKVEENTGYAH